ncbi:MAG: hypothetical protein GY943_13195 [Chloroflexi bacterium]|nr:hypothetical protein [Chloroflexota bacterium]
MQNSFVALIQTFIAKLSALFKQQSKQVPQAPSQPTDHLETAATAGFEAVSGATAKGNTMIKVRSKIGFHTGPGGNPSGIGDWMKRLDTARIPFFLKSADSYGPLFEAAELMKKSKVPHTLVFRLSSAGQGNSYDFDVPPYKDPKYVNDPEGGAEKHWRKTMEKLPPEFDKERVWLEPINEVDKNLCDWLGRFAVHTANLAQRDGIKVTLFGWSSGEPEPAGWVEPGMLEYLRLCAERPTQAAVAIHEYSFLANDINDGRPYKMGRFQFLFDICDRYDIVRPTIHITEWGWALNEVPGPSRAIEHIKDIGQLYAPYPEIKGAAIWYLGPGFHHVANQTQRLIKPVADFTMSHWFEVEEFSSSVPVHPPDFDLPTPELPPIVGPPPEEPKEPEEPVEPVEPEVPEEPKEPEVPEEPEVPKEPEVPEEPKEPVVPVPPPPAPQPNGIFIDDITVPDDTRIHGGTVFTKTWRVQNTGNVAWGSGYWFVHTDGVAMTDVVERPLPAAAPGEEVTISIEFTAPNQTGTHFSDWRFKDDQGNLFGDIIYTRIIAEKPVITGVSNGAYVADITIPDDMVIAPDTNFIKTWRVKNTGTRPWGPGFSVDFVGGTAMTSMTQHQLPHTAPGEEVDISIALTAPLEKGTYFGDWRMRDDRGFLFGEIIFFRIAVPAADAATEVVPENPVIEIETPTVPDVTRLQAGMNVNPDAPFSNPQDTADFNNLDWVRFVFKLAARRNAEERDDLAAAFAQYDPIIAKYDQMGVKSLIVINQETVWGNSPWESNRGWQAYADKLADVAGQIATHYKKYKDRVAYEIWNEGDFQDNKSSVFVEPENFATILKKTAVSINHASPKSPRIFGGLATGPAQAVDYLNRCRVACGGKLPVEAVGVHPYGRWGSKAPFDWGNKYGTLGEAFAGYEPGLNGLPLWITEIGVAADEVIGPDFYPQIGDYLRDVYETISVRHAKKVPVVIWFAWSDWMRNAGVVDKDGRRKSAVYAAFQDVRDQLM